MYNLNKWEHLPEGFADSLAAFSFFSLVFPSFGLVSVLDLVSFFGSVWLWLWPWPPLTILTNFSTARKAMIPLRTQRPTVMSCPWEWPSPWECPWEWEWCSSSPEWAIKACGIKCKNASPRSPPEAKLSKTLSRGWRSGLLSIGMKKSTINGATLMRRVEPIASVHRAIVVLFGTSACCVCSWGCSWSCSWSCECPWWSCVCPWWWRCSFSSSFLAGGGGGFGILASFEYLNDGRSSIWSCECPWWSCACPWWSCECPWSLWEWVWQNCGRDKKIPTNSITLNNRTTNRRVSILSFDSSNAKRTRVWRVITAVNWISTFSDARLFNKS